MTRGFIWLMGGWVFGTKHESVNSIRWVEVCGVYRLCLCRNSIMLLIQCSLRMSGAANLRSVSTPANNVHPDRILAAD